jgi:glyoxylase-like metal-dependent hydrolase (beta-lactamase superfamily II)
MAKPSALFVGGLMVLSAAAGAAQDDVDSRTFQRRGQAAVQAAIAASGGLDRLRNVTTVRLSEVGRHQWVYQSARAEPPWRQGEREEITLIDRRGDRLMTKTSVTHPTYYFGWPGALVSGTSGHILDHYSRMITPVARTSLADYRAHLYQRLPHEILLDALARAGSLRHLGTAAVAGRPHDVVVYQSFDGRQTTLYLDAATHLIGRYEQVFTDPVDGDSVTGVRFGDYRDVTGVQVPHTREQFRGAHWTIRTTYRQVVLDAPVDAAEFAIPADYELVAPQPAPQLALSTLAPGVHLLSGLGNGGRYNVMLAEFKDHLVLVNAPSSARAAEEILARAAAAFAGKPITTVALTHPAYDHIAGVRTLIAAGATVVAANQTAALVQRIARAPFTIEPDALATLPRDLRLEVIGGRRVFDDGTLRMELVDVGPDETGQELLVAHFPHARVLFQADIVNPNYAGALGAAQPPSIVLEQRMTALGLAVDRIAGGHGGVVTRDALRRSIALTRNH